ncbi:MAG: alpha/beta hydrolase [Flavobacteriaceae bacterium]|nr:alpha/beta hydrolase [Flavobacteriaceae bacterium]|tara:strand:+ start:15038 stop:15805 length:768 start_codon:yes stop_codon:yes gene_type:complete
MNKINIIQEKSFKYVEYGKGQPIILLHGLMGGLSNFNSLFSFFPKKGYKVLMPILPLYDMPIKETNVKKFVEYLNSFILFKKLKNIILIGNSLGGHIGLIYTKIFKKKVLGLVITGSSGLYENSMGDGYPKRGNYSYIKAKTEEVFYDPKIATKSLVDEIFETVNDRNKIIKTLTIAKSAIRHNMSKDLPDITNPSLIVWGKQDTVTPPSVAKEFNSLLPDSNLFWIDKCGHAPMMEHPDIFNKIVYDWIHKRGF